MTSILKDNFVNQGGFLRSPAQVGKARVRAILIGMLALWLITCGISTAAQPTIEFTVFPTAAVPHNQSYIVQARGTDPEGRLIHVLIDKAGAAFAHAGQSDNVGPAEGSSVGESTDSGLMSGLDRTITFTAKAVCWDGRESPTISATVTISAPKLPPTITWTGMPTVVAQNTHFVVRADAQDVNGDMVYIHIYKNGNIFSDELNANGGSPGRDASADNQDNSFLPPGTRITYTAFAMDQAGNRSPVIEKIVHVGYVDRAPTAGISPQNLQTYIGANIGLTVTASDPDNDLSRVDVWEWAAENVGAGSNWEIRKVAKVEASYASPSGGNISAPYNSWGGKIYNWQYSYLAVAYDVSGAISLISTQRHSYVNLTNSVPTIPTITPSQSLVQVGQSVTLTGVLSDIDANVTTIKVWWQYRASPNDAWGPVNTAYNRYEPSGTGSQTLSIPFQPPQVGYYRVWTRASDPYGSTNDIEVALTVSDVAPLPPTNVSVAGFQWNQLTNSFQMQIEWTKSTSPNVANQIIYWRPSGGAESSTSLGTGPVAEWITGIAPSTGYFVHLKTANGFGTRSIASNEVSVVSPSPPPVITSSSFVSVARGAPFSYTVTTVPVATSIIVAPNLDQSVGAGVIRGFPPGVAFNASTGVLSGVCNTPGTYSLKISASNSGGTKSIILNITVTDPNLAITSPGDVQAARGANFVYQIQASQPPTTYSADPVEGSSLPPGIVFNSGLGTLSGTAAVRGTYYVRVAVTTNAGNCERTIKITVVDAPVFVSSALASGTQGVPFTHQIVATNSAVLSFTGVLPSGLSFNLKTGTISGVPTTQGSSVVSIAATNAAGSVSQSLSIVIGGALPVITSATSLAIAPGAALNYQITATGFPSGYQAVESGRAAGLPSGLTFNSAGGVLSGSLSATGTYYVKITATNSAGSGSATLRISVSAPGAGEAPDVSGATMAGTLPASFSVDNRGAANYRVPLDCLPGRSGLQPALGVHYNSGAGNGPLGIGSSLATGFPRGITRGRTILARDGVSKGVSFDDSDKFYLDGKRLVVVQGNYGEAGSSYRTEVDSFAVITAYGAGGNIDGFRVVSKDGTSMCFGKGVRDASGQPIWSQSAGRPNPDDAYHVPADEGAGRAGTWALKWVEDTLGNYIEFRYNEVNLGGQQLYVPLGEHLLTSIRYTGNRLLNVDPGNIIGLRYNTDRNLSLVNGAGRPDEIRSFQAGRSTVSSARLDCVVMAQNSAGLSSPIRAYWFRYDVSAGLLRLTEVLRRDTLDGVSSVVGTELEWPGGTQTLTPAAGTYPAAPSGGATVTTNPLTDRLTHPAWRGDFNGDGRADQLFRTGNSLSILFRNDQSGWSPEVSLSVDVNPSVPVSELKIAVTGDFNGDGKTDLVWAHPRLSNPNGSIVRHGGWYVSLAKPEGNGFQAPALMVANSTTSGSDKVTLASAMALDLDGDGRDEFMFQVVEQIPNVDFSWLYQPAVYEDSVLVEAAPRANGSSTVLPNGALYRLRLSLQSGLWEESEIPKFYKGSIPMSLQKTDLDGDGRADFLATLIEVPDPSSAGYTVNMGWQVQAYRNMGTDGAGRPVFVATEEELMAHSGTVGGLGASAGHLMLTGDITGDGLDDLLIFADSIGWSLYRSKGDGTFDKAGVVIPATVTVGSNSAVKTYFQQPGSAEAAAVTSSDGDSLGIQVTRLEGFGITGAVLIDVNGDGRKDFAWYSAAVGWNCFIAGNSGFATAVPTSLFGGASDPSITYLGKHLNGGAPELIPEQMTCEFSAMDARGTGRESLLIIQRNVQDHWWVRVALAESNAVNPLRMVGTTDALGARTRIDYRAITDGSIYTSGVQVSYPIRESRHRTVVSDVWRDNGGAFTVGSGGENQHYSYQYSGARIDLSGRGDLGFHSFVTLDEKTKLFKYQFLAQSFPMTGMVVREETYRSLGNGQFRYISSHDSTVVFDEVVKSATDPAAWGTLFPFVSKAVQYRWEDSTSAHVTVSTSGASSSSEVLFPRQKPDGYHIKITAESWFDEQPKSGPVQTGLGAGNGFHASDTKSDRTNAVAGVTQFSSIQNLGLPRLITYGNLTQLTTFFDDSKTSGERVVTKYRDPAYGLTGLVEKVETFAWSPGYGTELAPEAAPTKRFSYWGATPLVASEILETADSRLNLNTLYTRDDRGRVTTTEIKGHNVASDEQYIGEYVISEATSFDDRFDLPTTVKNARPYSHVTLRAYHPQLGLEESVTDQENGSDGNRPKVTTTYDALGRVKQRKDVFRGLQTDTTIALTSLTATNWSKTENVTPPDGHTGVASGVGLTGVAALTLSSAYVVETKDSITATSTPHAPTSWTYFDRLGRPIRTVKENSSGKTATDTAYNSLGQVIAVSLPYAVSGSPVILWTKTDYDALGRAVKVTAPNGTETTTVYNGRATAVTVNAALLDGVDPLPQTNSTVVDARGRTVAVWNADNVPTFSGSVGTANRPESISFTLDGFGRMRQTVLRGQSTLPIKATYDAHGRQTQLQDPDKGTWNYVNDAFGRVVKQTDAKDTVTTTKFDRLGRPLSRVTSAVNDKPGANSADPKSTETATWHYYDRSDTAATNPAFNLTAKGTTGWIGALHYDQVSVSNAPGYQVDRIAHARYYDAKGRVEVELSRIDGQHFYTKTEYDAAGRPKRVWPAWRPDAENPFAPSSAAANWGYVYSYDGKGYVTSVTDSDNRTWWSNPIYDHLDRVQSVQKGPDAKRYNTVRTFREQDGVVTAIKTGTAPGGTSLQNLLFEYDGLGNLTKRIGPGGEEILTYDVLNRLTGSSKQGTTSYHDNGNIRNKPDVAGGLASADFTYYPNRPHAVQSARDIEYGYDANGNVNSRMGGGETWSFSYPGFDKPRWMAKTAGGSTVGSEFVYNANRSRVMHLEFNSMSGGVPLRYNYKKIYAAGAAAEVDYKLGSGEVSWQLDRVRLYVPAPDGTVGAMTLKTTAGAPEAQIFHYDHLGSLERITPYDDNSNTAMVDQSAAPGRPSIYSHDAWGERRDPIDWLGKPVTTAKGGHDGLSPRGYTGHEMLDDLGLVHMNGRIYDPLLGRFLSADTFVQKADDLQAYNRYSYVRNNPTSLNDPSGHFWSALITAGFAAYDTYQFATGQQSGAEYARNMAVNGAALAADVVTLGQGGGLGVRAAQIAARSEKAIVAIKNAAQTVQKVDAAVNKAEAAAAVVEHLADGDFAGAGMSASGLLGGGKNGNAHGAHANGVKAPAPHASNLNSEAIKTKKGDAVSTRKAPVTEASDSRPVMQYDAQKHPELAENIQNAQDAGHPKTLTHGGDKKANRDAALKTPGEEVPKVPGTTRDEYPFASSQEGGAGAWVGHVPASQQNAQGATIKNFIEKHDLKPGDQYDVEVINRKKK